MSNEKMNNEFEISDEIMDQVNGGVSGDYDPYHGPNGNSSKVSASKRCSICGERFDSRAQLNDHLKTCRPRKTLGVER